MIIATFNTRTANSFAGVAVFPLRKGVGGGVQTLNIVGALTPTSMIIRQPTRHATAFLDLAGSLGPLTLTRAFASAGPLAGSLVTQRQQTQTLVGTLGLSGGITAIIQRGFAGAVGLAGALIRRVTLVLAGAVTSTSTVQASPQIRQFAGTLGLAGTTTQIRSQLVSLASVLPLAGALTTRVSIALAGLIVSAGALRRTARQLFTAGLDLTGQLLVGLTLRLTGGLPVAGAVELTQGQAVALTSTLLSTGHVSMRPTVDVPGSLGLDGGLAMQPTVLYQGATGFDGAVLLGLDLQITGMLGLDGAMELTGDRIVVADGTLSMTGIVTRARLLILSGALASLHTLSFTVVPSKVIRHIIPLSGELTTYFAKAMAGVVTLSGTVRWRVTRILRGTVQPIGAAYRQATLRLAGAVGLAGDVGFVGVEILAVSGVIAPSGVLAAPLMARLLVGTLGPIGSVLLLPAILIRQGTIMLVRATLRFAGLASPQLTGQSTTQNPTLGDHTTLDDPELR